MHLRDHGQPTACWCLQGNQMNHLNHLRVSDRAEFWISHPRYHTIRHVCHSLEFQLLAASRIPGPVPSHRSAFGPTESLPGDAAGNAKMADQDWSSWSKRRSAEIKTDRSVRVVREGVAVAQNGNPQNGTLAIWKQNLNLRHQSCFILSHRLLLVWSLLPVG